MKKIGIQIRQCLYCSTGGGGREGSSPADHSLPGLGTCSSGAAGEGEGGSGSERFSQNQDLLNRNRVQLLATGNRISAQHRVSRIRGRRITSKRVRNDILILLFNEQECIPVGCVPSALYRPRDLPDRDPLDRDPPWTEIPLTEIPLTRDTLDRDPPGQRPPVDR